MASYAPEFLSLALIHFLAVVAPGPDFAITISQSVRHGRSAGIYTALGIGAGISVHVIYTILGIGALMHASTVLMNAARIIGALYICYLAVNLLRAQPAVADDSSDIQGKAENQTNGKSFSIGFFTNATNPKATLFFLAVFTTMVSATTPLSIQAGYGVWMCAVNASWFVIVALFFSNPKVRQSFLKTGYWFERCMGGLLLAFAMKLLWGMTS
ncbi:LysE family translocator [Verminephrobacter eiseniae]|uniref:Lysine exporter protein (LYSE/YGGA) n=1 Tax=Verminephrobacter eiseniae (strain EF01-2) TaxID=391735 RepID=A1WIE1_VEREI|nr:LysE family translocator [Verminephrobacter eiseniae]ABM57398.1 Lysine exporter protein (LYSE/YGGA) [Verminephrobacter eiseniae EF01-2]MCW5283025.1 LysE family translocator [Verminephrobacter eiseniae]MCW5303340.1 LysE family translocator [Verminephrobacter eiseniae]MCW8180440.1 LysE family translocator [Verminephrobacter eiseniae]MCW8188733.1 LysE family translocator [Verminephrobacter eiseniae]